MAAVRRAMGRGVYALEGVLYDATTTRVTEVADLLHAMGLPGKHNWQNAAAAISVNSLCAAVPASAAASDATAQTAPAGDVARMAE